MIEEKKGIVFKIIKKSSPLSILPFDSSEEELRRKEKTGQGEDFKSNELRPEKKKKKTSRQQMDERTDA